jgi:hypothetical protein
MKQINNTVPVKENVKKLIKNTFVCALLEVKPFFLQSSLNSCDPARSVMEFLLWSGQFPDRSGIFFFWPSFLLYSRKMFWGTSKTGENPWIFCIKNGGEGFDQLSIWRPRVKIMGCSTPTIILTAASGLCVRISLPNPQRTIRSGLGQKVPFYRKN